MIIKIENPGALESAVNAVRQGRILAYPTDTLYGLGVDATNAAAIARINRLKGRTGPVSVIAPDVETALAWTTLTTAEQLFVRPYLGGKQTAVLPVRTGIVAPDILGPNSSLGIRIPDQPFILELVKKAGVPLTTTSVNRSGQPPLNDPLAIEQAFGTEIDLIIAGGVLPSGTGSKIYRWHNRDMLSIR